MEDSFFYLIETVENCIMPKLARNLDESETHSEFDIWINKLDQHFPIILKLLQDTDLKLNLRSTSSVLASLIILSHELNSFGSWSTPKCKEYSLKLNSHFELLYETDLEKFLQKVHIFNTQEVFEQCLEKLHQKLSSGEITRYPGLIEVYCSLMQDIQSYNVSLNPTTTLPISLLLIDDHVTANKIKGLKCCSAILDCLSPKEFVNGNYFEVIYGCLMKTVLHKNIEVTKLIMKCFLLLLKVLPSNVIENKTDELYSNILNQLSTESNLYRKAELFTFTKCLIQIHGVNCAKKKIFKTIACDSIDICCNETVGLILLNPVLECLEEWIKHCWCIWHLYKDHKLLSILFKCLYRCKEENELQVNKIIITLIGFCTEIEQEQIIKSLEKSYQLESEQFHQRIDVIKKYICV